MADFDIGTLSGGLEIKDGFSNVFDSLAERVGAAAAALDHVSAKAASSGKEIGQGFEEAAKHSKVFGDTTEESLHKVEHSSHEAAAQAAETKASFMEMFENPLAAAKEFAHEIESEVLGALGAIGIAAAAALGATLGLGYAITELGQEGSKIIGVQNSFNSLAKSIGQSGTELRESLGEALKHTVGDFQIMQSMNVALGAGVKLTTADMTTLGETARALGKATGGSAADGLDTLSNALARGNTRALSRLGITVDMQMAEKKFADSIGTTKDRLNEAGILEAKRQGILQASRDYLEKMGVAESLWTTKVKQGQVAIAEWGESLAVAVARSPAINAAVTAIAKALEEAFGGKGQTAIDLIVAGLDHFADFVKASVPYVVSAFEAVKSFWDWLVQLNDEFHITDTLIDLAKDAWDGLTKAFDFVREAANKAIETWKSMPPWLQNMAVKSAEATAALYVMGKTVEAAKGPVERIVESGLSLIGIFANLAQITGGTLTGALELITGIFEGMGAAFAELGVGGAIIEALTGPIGWTIGALTLLGAAIYGLVKYWDQVKDATVYTWDVIKNSTKTAWDAIVSIFNYVADSSVAHLIEALAQLDLKILGWVALAAGAAIWKSFNLVIEAAVGYVELLWKALTKFWEILTAIVKASGVFDTLAIGVSAVVFIFDKWVGLIEKVISGIKWLNEHTPNPLNYLPSSPPTPGPPGMLQSRDITGKVTIPTQSGGHLPGAVEQAPAVDPSKFLKPGDALAAAVKSATEKTQGIWDQYYQLQAKMSGDDLGAKLADIDRWAEREMAGLDENKIGYAAYYEGIASISSLAFLKRLDAETQHEKKLTDEVLKADETRLQEEYNASVAAADRQKALDAANNTSYIAAQRALVEETNKLTMTKRDFEASQLEQTLADAKLKLGELGEGYRATYDEIEQTTKDKLSEIGVEWDDATHEWVHTFDFMWSKGGVEHSMLPPNLVKTTKSSLTELSGVFGALGNDISQISQISQGTFGNVVKDIGLAVKAAEAFAKAIEATGQTTGATAGKKDGTAQAAGSVAATAGAVALIPIVGAWIAVGIAVYSFVTALREANKEAEKLAKVTKAIFDAAVAFHSGTNFSNALGQQLSDTEEDFAHITALNTRYAGSLASLQQMALAEGVAIRDRSGHVRDLAGNILTADEAMKLLHLDTSATMESLSQAAHLSDILKELGGVSQLTADELKMVQDRANQLFILIGLGGPTGQAAIKTMDDTLIQFTTDLTKSGGLVSQYFLDMAAKAKAAGIELKQVAAFQASQAQAAETGIVSALTATNAAYAKRKELQQQIADATENLQGKTGQALVDAKKKLDDLNAQLITQQKIIDAVGIHSQAAAGAIAGALLGVISSQVEAGMSFGDAIRAAGPGIEALRDQLATLGGGGGQAFDFLNQQISLFTDEVTGPALQSIEGYADGLVGLHNAGQLNQDTFAGITEQIGKTADALMAQGVSGPALLSAMQSPLQKIWELEKNFGYAADASTQALIDQAVADGIVGEKHKSVADQMLDMTERMTKAIEYVAKAFGYVAPAAEDAASGVSDAFNDFPTKAKSAVEETNIWLSKIKAPPVTIDWDVKDLPPGTVFDGPEQPPYQTLHKAAGGPVGTDTIPAWLSPGEYVLSTNQISSMTTKFQLVDSAARSVMDLFGQIPGAAKTATDQLDVWISKMKTPPDITGGERWVPTDKTPPSNPQGGLSAAKMPIDITGGERWVPPPINVTIDARGAWFDEQGIEELSAKIQKPFWTAVHQNDASSQTMAMNALKMNE